MRIERKSELLDLLRRHRQQLKELGVQRCGIFGSFAREQQTAASDVDILVEFEPGRKSFDNFMQLAFFLEEKTGRKVELVTPESLSPYLGPRILSEVEYAAIGS